MNNSNVSKVDTEAFVKTVMTLRHTKTVAQLAKKSLELDTAEYDEVNGQLMFRALNVIEWLVDVDLATKEQSAQ